MHQQVHIEQDVTIYVLSFLCPLILFYLKWGQKIYSNLLINTKKLFN
jgi:hypothetical protein